MVLQNATIKMVLVIFSTSIFNFTGRHLPREAVHLRRSSVGPGHGAHCRSLLPRRSKVKFLLFLKAMPSSHTLARCSISHILFEWSHRLTLGTWVSRSASDYCAFSLSSVYIATIRRLASSANPNRSSRLSVCVARLPSWQAFVH